MNAIRIEPTGNNRAMWRIRGSRGEPGEFLLALILEGSSHGNLRLTFHRYGETNFLVGFKTPSYEVVLPASKSEKNLRLVSGPLADMEVVEIETVNGNTR